MSENLYLPLALWGIVLCDYGLLNRTDEKCYKYGYCGILIGMYIFILYLSKEIGVVFLIAYFLTIIIKICKYGIIKCKKDVIQFGIAIITFVCCYILMKNTVFKGMNNMYSNQVKNIFIVKGGVNYVLYAVFTYIFSILVSLFIIPIMLPMLNYKLLNDRQKDFFNFLILLTGITIIIVAYTTSYVENFGDEFLRTHLRYFGYLYIPFIILLYSIIEDTNIIKKEKVTNFKHFYIILLFSCAVIFFKIPKNDSGLDHTVLNWVYFISKITNIYIIKCGLVIMLFVFILLHYKRKYNTIKILFFAIFLMFEIINSKEIIKINNRTIISKNEISDILVINNYIKGHPNSNFLIINEGLNIYQRILDTYIYGEKIYLVNTESYINAEKNGGINLSETRLKSFVNDTMYSNLNKVSYIIIPNKISKKFNPEGEKFTTVVKTETFNILKISDNNQLPELWNSFFKLQAHNDNVILKDNQAIVSYDGVIYGPYIDLPAGKYKIKFICEFLEDSMGEFGIAAVKGGRSYFITQIFSKENVVFIEFELKEKAHNVEFIVHNVGKTDFIVKDIEFKLIKNRKL